MSPPVLKVSNTISIQYTARWEHFWKIMFWKTPFGWGLHGDPPFLLPRQQDITMGTRSAGFGKNNRVSWDILGTLLVEKVLHTQPLYLPRCRCSAENWIASSFRPLLDNLGLQSMDHQQLHERGAVLKGRFLTHRFWAIFLQYLWVHLQIPLKGFWPSQIWQKMMGLGITFLLLSKISHFFLSVLWLKWTNLQHL